MTWSVDNREPPSPAAPGLMNEVVVVAKMDVMQGLCNMHYPTLRLTCLWPLLSTQSASQIPTLSP